MPMSDINEIYCADCGKFILKEEKKEPCGDIKCTAGSYNDGFYYGLEDIFICKECATKRGLK